MYKKDFDKHYKIKVLYLLTKNFHVIVPKGGYPTNYWCLNLKKESMYEQN